jgi:ketosteroid isomerase-like protein
MPQPPHEAEMRHAFEAWNAGDFDAWLADAHPDFEYRPGIIVGPAEGEPIVYRSRDELRRFFDEWHSAWRMKLTMDRTEQLGDWMLVLGRAQFTGVQSGASAEQEVGFIAQSEDGRVRRIWSYPTHEAAQAAAETAP